MKEVSAEDVIKALQLTPLPEEGGYYREIFRDKGKSHFQHLDGERNFSTSIFYLVTPEEFSGLHGVKSSEVFHFYGGDPVQMVQIDSAGNLSKIILGSNFLAGENPQVTVEPHVWQGTKLVSGGRWALLGCTVAPGFDFQDFIPGQFNELKSLFPQHEKLIKEYTHN